jgi:hypothetical protein
VKHKCSWSIELKKKREFLEENRKLVQLKIDHPETEKTRIQTGAIEGYNLVLTRQKLTLVRGGHRGTI